jgi:hypothetical protein
MTARDVMIIAAVVYFVSPTLLKAEKQEGRSEPVYMLNAYTQQSVPLYRPSLICAKVILTIDVLLR